MPCRGGGGGGGEAGGAGGNTAGNNPKGDFPGGLGRGLRDLRGFP